MKPDPRNAAGARGARFGVAAVAVVALVALALVLGPARHQRPAWAQEQELPGVASDSMVTGPGRPGVPAVTTPPVPTPPVPTPGGINDQIQLNGRDLEELRSRIHGGDNDLVKVGEDIEVGPGDHVLGDVFAMGGNVTVRGQVDGDVVAMGGDVSVEDGAQVRGDAVSLGGQVRKAQTAIVLGKTVTVGAFPRHFFQPHSLWAFGHGVAFFVYLFKILFWMFIGWIVVAIVPARSRRVLEVMRAHLGASLGWGLLGLIAIVPALLAVVLVAVLLCVTIIGIPVGVLLILGYCVAVGALLLWGGVLGATRVGEWVIGRLSPRLGEPTLVRSTLVGIAAVTLPGLLGSLFGMVGLDFFPAGALGAALRVLTRLLELAALLVGMGAILKARAGQLEPIRMPWGGPGPGPVPAPSPVAPPPPVPPAPYVAPAPPPPPAPPAPAPPTASAPPGASAPPAGPGSSGTTA